MRHRSQTQSNEKQSPIFISTDVCSNTLNEGVESTETDWGPSHPPCPTRKAVIRLRGQRDRVTATRQAVPWLLR